MKYAPAKSHVNTKKPVKNDGVPRLPHERDQTPDDQTIEPQKEMKQAYKDLQKGLVDTDMHGDRGVEQTVKRPANASRRKSGK